MNSLQYTVTQTTESQFKSKMPYLTSSMVEAVNTCPRWGIIHNVLGKRFVTGYRQMALEAGSLMHDVFMCLNLLQVGLVQDKPLHMHHHGAILFTPQRWEHIWSEGQKEGETLTIEKITKIERMLFAVIATSDYYDDPNDKNRTLSNLETCTLELFQYWLIHLQKLDILIMDEDDPSQPIGVEISLDGVFDIETPSKIVTDAKIITKIRAIGLADAVYRNKETGEIALGEYKTAAMMNDAWRLAFDTRHQLTLYNALLQAIFGRQETFKTILIGSAIPVRQTSAPVQHFEVMRDQENIHQMLNTFMFTSGLIRQYEIEPLETPMFTHSCNRYFRPCSQLDLCTASREDQIMMLENMEVEKTLSPSEEKAMLRYI